MTSKLGFIVLFCAALLALVASAPAVSDDTALPVCTAPNMVASTCTNICPEATCATQKQLCFSLRCGPPGCRCAEDHVLLTGSKADGCAKLEDCPKMEPKNKN